MLTNILLTLTLVFQIAIVAILVVALLKLYRNIVDFITPDEPGKPSALANFVDAAATMLARAVLAQAKGFLMGLQSGQARSEKAVQADLLEGLATQSPLGALLMSFPALRKSIRRNPALIDVALSAMTKGSMSIPGLTVNSMPHDRGSPPKFDL